MPLDPTAPSAGTSTDAATAVVRPTVPAPTVVTPSMVTPSMVTSSVVTSSAAGREGHTSTGGATAPGPPSSDPSATPAAAPSSGDPMPEDRARAAFSAAFLGQVRRVDSSSSSVRRLIAATGVIALAGIGVVATGFLLRYLGHDAHPASTRAMVAPAGQALAPGAPGVAPRSSAVIRSRTGDGVVVVPGKGPTDVPATRTKSGAARAGAGTPRGTAADSAPGDVPARGTATPTAPGAAVAVPNATAATPTVPTTTRPATTTAPVANTSSSAPAADLARAPAAPTPAAAAPAPAPKATYSAISGPGCSNTDTRNWYVNGYYTDARKGFYYTSGGYSGEGCSGQSLSMPMSGSSAPTGQNYVVWWFRTAPVSEGTCRFSVYVPDTGSSLDAASTSALYKVMANGSSSTVQGTFQLNQAGNRGGWVGIAPVAVHNGAVALHLADRGEDPAGEHLAAAQVTVSCTAA